MDTDNVGRRSVADFTLSHGGMVAWWLNRSNPDHMNRAAWRRLPALDEWLRFVTEEDSVPASIRVLDVVALTEDVPVMRLRRGQVGTVVEVLAPEVYEVEFCDDEGRTYTSTALSASQLLVLRYRPQFAA